MVGATDRMVGTTDRMVGTTDRMVGATDRMVGTTDRMVRTTDTTVGTTDRMVGTTDTTVGATDRMVGTTDTTVGATDRMLEAPDDISWYHAATTHKGSRLNLSPGSDSSGYCAMMSPTSLIIMATPEIAALQMVTLFTHKMMKPEMVMPTIIIIIRSFYIELVYALEQTHCAHWHVILSE